MLRRKEESFIPSSHHSSSGSYIKMRGAPGTYPYIASLLPKVWDQACGSGQEYSTLQLAWTGQHGGEIHANECELVQMAVSLHTKYPWLEHEFRGCKVKMEIIVFSLNQVQEVSLLRLRHLSFMLTETLTGFQKQNSSLTLKNLFVRGTCFLFLQIAQF